MSPTQARQDIRRLARGREAYHDITRLRQGLQLANEYLLVTKIIGQSRQRRGIRMERQGRKRTACALIMPEKFRSQMLSISGTASITQKKYFASLPVDLDKPSGGLLDLRLEGFQDGLHGGLMPLNMTNKN